MSKREKSTVLFSRNGIKIERVDYLDMTKYSNNQYKDKFITNVVTSILKSKDKKPEVIPAQKAWDEIITHTSKLGFYYYEKIHHSAKEQEIHYNNKFGTATYKTFTFQYDNKRFVLSYPISCGDVSINRETRPWDILPGYKGIIEHFITDLYKEVNKFFEVAEVNRVAYRIKERTFGYNGTPEKYAPDMSWVYDVKKQVMIDLFGDEKGPSVNYNDIKILSHGFDLKESFRKRKES
jgi:hypothetical protein